MSLANENEPKIELTYGELTMIKLEELLGCAGDEDRSALPVGADFWEWRKENAKRGEVLNKAGLVLNREVTGTFKIGKKTVEQTRWTANMTKVTADTLDEAIDGVRAWTRTEKELKERARVYMRQCEAVRQSEFGR